MDPLEIAMLVNQVSEANQDVVIDLDGNIFETQVELGLISKLKSILKVIPNVISQFAIDLVRKYSIEPSYVCLEFIHWSASNYAVKNRVLMSSNASQVLCKKNPQFVSKAPHLLESNLEECFPFDG